MRHGLKTQYPNPTWALSIQLDILLIFLLIS
jgi:hypothetical protein